MDRRIVFAAAAIVAAVGLSNAALAARAAKAALKDASGKDVGVVNLTETAHGVLLDVQIRNLPEGEHGFHIHETGKCEPPSFESAGGHFNPGNEGHGMMDADGMHAGDLPNIFVSTAPLHLHLLAQSATLGTGKTNSLLDGDGAAIVIHQNPDDYRSDPSGTAGKRIACGVIEATERAPGEKP